MTIEAELNALDITIKQDVIEEIARLHGYDKLDETLPKMSVSGALTKTQKMRRTIGTTLSELGLREALTYTLVSGKFNEKFTTEELELLYRLGAGDLDLNLDYIAADLAKGTHYGSRKIDIDFILTHCQFDSYLLFIGLGNESLVKIQEFTIDRSNYRCHTTNEIVILVTFTRTIEVRISFMWIITWHQELFGKMLCFFLDDVLNITE